MDDALEPQLNGADQVPPHELSLPREQPPLNGQTMPHREQIPSPCAESSSHVVPPKEMMIQLTQEALLALIHDASTRRPPKPWLSLRRNTPSIRPLLHLVEVENYPRLPRRRSRGRRR
ncbi:UNVERIFIED_CONTAM: hypothetical protein Sradi_5056700 [Sesamum radiatum]|uniref:Uncharacterized protein n=1 Tax=Sesamum radiatum TaxID=300843 RepID=A0AAW2M037_SESRA